MNILMITNPMPVGREGNRFLLAQVDDISKGELNGPALVVDFDVSPPSVTQPQNLQIWFKWANWEETTKQEYDEVSAGVA